MKFKHFSVEETIEEGLEKKVNEWLEGKDVKHVISIPGFKVGGAGHGRASSYDIFPSVGIFYEDPKSFTKTVREAGK